MGTNSLSRRNFLKGGVAAAAIGGLSMMGCANSSEQLSETGASADPNMPESWDYEADIVVLGSGCGGMYAAIEAANQGSSVLILEAAPPEYAGGAMRASAGAILPKSWVSEYISGLWSFGETSKECADSIEAGAKEALAWLDSRGHEWLNEEKTYSKDRGPGLYQTLLDAVEEAGIEVMYETPGKSLIVSQDGEVRGVKAGTDANINVKAKKAVLLFSGDYLSNKQLLGDFNLPGFKVYSLGSPYAQGDALLMAGEVGARIGRTAKGLELGKVVSVAASEEYGTGIATNIAGPSTIYVNNDAVRFMNESADIQHDKTQHPLTEFSGSFNNLSDGTARYTNETFWMVCDQEAFEADTLGNGNYYWSWAVNCEDEEFWSMDNEEELEKGWIIKADTLEELADKIDIDPAVFQQTVAEYNADCEAGADKFGREPEKMAPIGDGPYYAVELGLGCTYTIGGIVHDDNCRTLNWRDEPIPRLYSGGNTGMSCSKTVTIGLGGTMAQGKIAAADAVTLEPWC